jgi:hypothetical protein
VHGREMVYPKGRYTKPIFMDSTHYDWAPVRGAKGVAEKLLGVWTERRIEAGLIRLEPGAKHEVHGRGVFLVLSGGGTCQGQPLRKFTTVYLDQDESTILQASETIELLHYGLPDLTGLAASDHTSGVMQAAE